MVAESHPKADAVGINIFGERMQLVMARQIDGLFSGDGKIVSPFLRMDGLEDPFAVDPGPNFPKTRGN